MAQAESHTNYKSLYRVGGSGCPACSGALNGRRAHRVISSYTSGSPPGTCVGFFSTIGSLDSSTLVFLTLLPWFFGPDVSRRLHGPQTSQCNFYGIATCHLSDENDRFPYNLPHRQAPSANRLSLILWRSIVRNSFSAFHHSSSPDSATRVPRYMENAPRNA